MTPESIPQSHGDLQSIPKIHSISIHFPFSGQADESWRKLQETRFKSAHQAKVHEAPGRIIPRIHIS